MSDYIKKIRTTTGDKQIDYNALANLPTIPNYTVATQSNSGLMSGEDKKKLDGVNNFVFAFDAAVTRVNANTLTSAGIYKVYLPSELDLAEFNFPTNVGVLTVLSPNEPTQWNYVSQLFLSTSGAWSRMSTDNGTSWSPWKYLHQ